MLFSRKPHYSLYKPGPRRSSFFTRILRTLILFFILYEVVTAFIISTVTVETGVMLPNIQRSDRILIFYPAYRQKVFNTITLPGFSEPQRGDIVVYHPGYVSDYPILLRPVNAALKFFTLQSVNLATESQYSEKNTIMRVIGVPGDTVRVKNNVVSIKTSGGERFLTEFELTENRYNINISTYPENWDNNDNPFVFDLEETVIQPGFFFLMGDNRDIYPDSRVTGPVKQELIRGKAVMRYWPLSEIDVF